MKKTILFLTILCFSQAKADIVLSSLIKTQSEKLEGNSADIPVSEGKDILTAIEDLSALNIKAVRNQVYHYATSGKAFYLSAVKNAEIYRPVIEDIVNGYPEIPIVISDLPILESNYNPYAVSHAGAAGLWQFMPKTATIFNLSINRWEDGRRCLINSTHAAMQHLYHLYKHHKSWELALAAYNCGSTRINQAVANHPQMTYWEIVETGALPTETSLYVQRFAALSILYRHNSFFGLPSTPEQNVELFGIPLKKPVSIPNVSEKTGIPESTIYLFNPQLKKSITPLVGEGYVLLIPENYYESFVNNEDKIYTLPYSRIKTYTVVKGDHLSRIAKKHNTSIDQLIHINKLKKPYIIRPGNQLLIPLH